MIIIPNLKNVMVSDTSDRIVADGIYIRDDVYYVTFVHGDENGNMEMESPKGNVRVTPATIRIIIEMEYDYAIPEDKTIVLNPCFPKKVKERYSSSELWNVKIAADWDAITHFSTVRKHQGRPITASSSYVKLNPEELYEILLDFDSRNFTIDGYLNALKEGSIE